MEDWIYIDDFKGEILDNIHCDTRDFYIITYNLDSDKRNEIINSVKHKTPSCIFKSDEIIPILKSLEEKSEGKAEWRMLTTRAHPGWLKYIRFIKIKDQEYIAYEIVGMNKYKALHRYQLMSEINKEYLATQ